jgi:hypothetical protein
MLMGEEANDRSTRHKIVDKPKLVHSQSSEMLFKVPSQDSKSRMIKNNINCSGYDIEACWRKETPRPQDSWHNEYGGTDSDHASGSRSQSSSPSPIRFENASILTEKGATQDFIPPPSLVSLAGIPSAAAFRRWLESLTQSPAVYCSGAALSSLMSCIVNPGVMPSLNVYIRGAGIHMCPRRLAVHLVQHTASSDHLRNNNSTSLTEDNSSNRL